MVQTYVSVNSIPNKHLRVIYLKHTIYETVKHCDGLFSNLKIDYKNKYEGCNITYLTKKNVCLQLQIRVYLNCLNFMDIHLSKQLQYQ